MKDIPRQDGEMPWYMIKNDPNKKKSNEIGAKPAWKPGDEPSWKQFFAAFQQGRDFKRTYDAERQAERAARLLAEAEEAEMGEADGDE